MSPRDQKEIRALTGIRGVAACLVMLHHFFPGESGPHLLRNIVSHGYIYIDLFFVLSGFVMALTYGPVFQGKFGIGDYIGFLYKRLGRIYPLYLFVTLLMAARGFLSFAPVAIDRQTLVSNVFLVQAWGFADSIGGPTWSISTEFFVYLIFPLLVYLNRDRGFVAITIAASAAVALLLYVASRQDVDLNQVYEGRLYRYGPLDVFGSGAAYPLLRCLAGFILGLVSFRIFKTASVKRIMGGSVAAPSFRFASSFCWRSQTAMLRWLSCSFRSSSCWQPSGRRPAE